MVLTDLGVEFMPVVDDFLRRHPKIETRDYQRRIISKMVHAWMADPSSPNYHKFINVEAPVGAGKTIMALIGNSILQELVPGLTTSWSAMRRNLLDQVVEEKNKFDLKLRLVPISMFEREPDLSNLNGRPINHVDDESHHQAAASAITLRNRMSEASNRRLRGLGLSGTPLREDGAKLGFSLVIRDASARHLIRDGHLSQFDYYSLDKWNNRVAVDIYCESPDRWGRSVMFFHTIEECTKVVKRLRKNGIRAELVEKCPFKRIDQLVEFKAGKWQVLVGCLALTEGYNDPDLKTVFLRSSCKGISIQMGGRVLRKSPLFPRKQIVQAEKGWCFMKYASPAGQYVRVEKEWRSIEANGNVDAVSTKMVQDLAARVIMPVSEIEEKLHKRKSERTARKF